MEVRRKIQQIGSYNGREKEKQSKGIDYNTPNEYIVADSIQKIGMDTKYIDY